MHGASNFSQIWVEDFICSADLDMKFGELSIDKIRQGFCNVNIISDYADLNLYLEKGVTFQADLITTKMCT